MSGYSTRDVAELLGLAESRVRAFVREEFIVPQRDARGNYRFSFQDVVLLRTAKELADARVPARRIWRALRILRDELPSGQPLSAIRISAEGDRVVIRERDTVWNPESGQVTFDFSVAELATDVAPLVRRAAESAVGEDALDSDEWFDLGLDLEAVGARDEAFTAYTKAVELDPDNASAHINLGRLYHESGDAAAAERQFRAAFESTPGDALASYNLGVALEDLQREDEAMLAYRRALKLDPTFADAHYNLAMIYERRGNEASALRHLSRYRALNGAGGT